MELKTFDPERTSVLAFVTTRGAVGMLKLLAAVSVPPPLTVKDVPATTPPEIENVLPEALLAVTEPAVTPPASTTTGELVMKVTLSPE